MKIKTGQLPTYDRQRHTGRYLDSQESDVSKLFVETSNLIIMNPRLVLCGHLRTTCIVRSISGSSSGKKKKYSLGQFFNDP